MQTLASSPSTPATFKPFIRPAPATLGRSPADRTTLGPAVPLGRATAQTVGCMSRTTHANMAVERRTRDAAITSMSHSNCSFDHHRTTFDSNSTPMNRP
ncbi:phospholipid-transporting atpase [Dorcoceras hygrometricum]|uniref:Phospholipid-transporting atpase n=1 Tax=Dorcoceras hygrometricum TaxID=472368 RepID=A0A2Z7CPK6_9LAMI|nr:phospholipid-transporting atpase [Dorcoceras hygrometricum]